MNRLKLSTAALASAGIVSLTGPALAQAQSSTGTAASSQATEEIVITATRRSERLQDVPLAVNAISGEKLAASGFQSLQDIQYQFSGVQFGTSPNDAGFRLRGVGTAGGFSSASEQNVGTVVDNVVIPFGNPVSSLGDLERVEVLKGPQGTQFGKNSSSGVVNITTRRPSLTRYESSVFASYAELNEHDVHASANVPLGGNAAFNVYAFHREHDGFVENVVRNEKWGKETTQGARAKLLWNITDDFSAYFIGDWSEYKRVGPGQLWTINKLPSFSNPLMAARFAPVLALGINPGIGNDKSAEEFQGFGGEKDYGGSVELNWQIGGDYELTSVSAYRKLDDQPNNFAIDGSPFPVFTARQSGVDQSFASEELRLTSPQGRPLQYVAGVYLSRRKSGYGSASSAQLRPGLPFSATPQVSISAGLSSTQTKTDSAAVFFDGTQRLTETVRLLGGLRYSHDKVNAESFSVVDPAYPPGAGPNGFVVPYTPRPLATGSVSKGDLVGPYRSGVQA